MLSFVVASSAPATVVRHRALQQSALSTCRLLHRTTPARLIVSSALRADAQKPARTLQHQATLPRLPVPPLEQTIAKYLKSLEPIFAQQEELGQLPAGATAESELAKRKAWAEEFLADKSIAHTLQLRLRDVDATTPNNWLDDRYWLQKAYHEWRVPLLINSNWWLLFAPDTALQSEADLTHAGDSSEFASTSLADVAKLAQDMSKPIDVSALLGPANWDSLDLGLRRAAWLTWRLIEFKTRLDAEQIAPDVSRAGAFCMNQYTNVYGVTRIPALPHDWNTRPAPPTVPASQAVASDPPSYNITVLLRNHFYDLQVIDPESGKILSPQSIEDGLKAIVADAKTRGDAPGVGVLSSDDRDTWAQAREQLLHVSEKNVESIQSIQRSLFALSIDTSVLPLPDGHDDPVAVSPTWVDAHARNESGTGRGGHNRWFDKSLSLIVEPNGRAGILGEHSPVDALIPGNMADYASVTPATPPGQPFPQVNTTTKDQISLASAKFTRRDFDVDDTVAKAIDASTRKALAIAADSDARELWYNEYGAEWIKKVAKVSPDAYLQTVLQVAMALTHGSQTPTYETASTRFFKNGRTDVIRSFSIESYDFVRSLLRSQGKDDPAKQYERLVKTCSAHTAQTRDSSFGKGIDRHLTGLRLVFDASRDGQVPALLSDEALGASQTWTLSTSGLSAGDRIAGTGFGSGYPDGYGCNYLAGSKLLKFGLESNRSTPTTSTTVFAKNVVKALRLIREVVEKGAPAASPKP